MITMVGETQANIGNRFYFMGPLTDCKECKLRGVCFSLEPGALYEIVALRDNVHECGIHEGPVRVVEVEKRPVMASVASKQAIDGSTVTFEREKCMNIGCGNRAYCFPPGIKDGAKLRITEVIGELECPEEKSVTLVRFG